MGLAEFCNLLLVINSLLHFTILLLFNILLKKQLKRIQVHGHETTEAFYMRIDTSSIEVKHFPVPIVNPVLDGYHGNRRMPMDQYPAFEKYLLSSGVKSWSVFWRKSSKKPAVAPWR